MQMYTFLDHAVKRNLRKNALKRHYADLQLVAHALFSHVRIQIHDYPTAPAAIAK